MHQCKNSDLESVELSELFEWMNEYLAGSAAKNRVIISAFRIAIRAKVRALLDEDPDGLDPEDEAIMGYESDEYYDDGHRT